MADASGWAKLGDALGGTSELEYEKGLALGAQTQNALAEARARVEKAQAQKGLKDKMVAAGFSDADADAASTALTAGAGLGDVLGAQAKRQEIGFRGVAGAPGSTPAERNAALAGIAAGPVEPFYNVGAGAYANKFSDEGLKPLGDALGGSHGGGDAAIIQIWRAAGLLDENGQLKQDHASRVMAGELQRQQNLQYTAGGVPYNQNTNPFITEGAPPRAPGQPAAPVVAPLATAEQVASNEAATTAAKKEAELRTEAKVSLPDTLANVDKLKTSVEGLLHQPGFSSVYGHLAGTDVGKIASGLYDQDSANAQAALQNIDAQTFGVTIQQMRGLGQLSNQEGLKVTNAFTRANNTHISPEEAQKAWAEVLSYLDLAASRAKLKAGNPTSATSANGGAQSFNTEAEALASGVKGRVIIGGRPATID